MKTSTRQLIERMYWNHSYTIEGIAHRLRLTEEQVTRVIQLSKQYKDPAAHYKDDA